LRGVTGEDDFLGPASQLDPGYLTYVLWALPTNQNKAQPVPLPPSGIHNLALRALRASPDGSPLKYTL